MLDYVFLNLTKLHSLMDIKFKISRSEWVSFVLTLVATLVGVLIAISLSNSSVEKKERLDAIKLFKTMRVLMKSTIHVSTEQNEVIEKIQLDTSYTQKFIEQSIKNNPLPFPKYIRATIANREVLSHISSFTHQKIYKELLILEKLANYETATYYLERLEVLEILLDLEIQYLNGDMSEADIEKEFNKQKNEIHKKYKENVFDEY